MLRQTELARAALTAHLLALPAGDRRLRFGASISSAALAAYVDGIDFRRDALFGVHADELALVGAALAQTQFLKSRIRGRT